MRTRTLFLLAGLLIGVAAVGCGANEVEMGEGTGNPSSTPTPTASPTGTATPTVTPDPATFTPVQSFLEIGGTPNRANCGQAACHPGPGGGASGIPLYTAPGTAAGDVASNAEQFSCAPNITTYDPPTGNLFGTFCNQDGTALAAPQHVSRTNLTDADCAAIVTFLSGGSGTPPSCP